ncbi:MAG: hypothetical protein ACOYXB_00285 [Bacteroidota bacterium]
MKKVRIRPLRASDQETVKAGLSIQAGRNGWCIDLDKQENYVYLMPQLY